VKQTKFSLKQFQNPSGAIVWRVTGWLNDERIRLNFKTRAEAAAEKSALEIKACQATSGLRATTTLLTEEQLREAEVIFQKMENPRLFSAYMEFALANYREPTKEQALADTAKQYLEAREGEHNKKLLSKDQYSTIRKTLIRFCGRHKQLCVHEITPVHIKAFCEGGNAALKTYNNRRGILSTFFRYALQNEWVGVDPVGKVQHFRIAHKRGTAPTLSAEQAAELMKYVESYEGGKLVPFFALCLFAGIRPCLRGGEMSRLRPEHVKKTGVIHIEPEVSKVDMKRSITIQSNLAEWLKAYPLSEYPIQVKNMEKLRARVAKKFKLTHDVMRHTFISMHVAKYRSMGDTALQAGNSEAIIRRHYLNVTTSQEAEMFFAIMPTKKPKAETAQSDAVSENIVAAPTEGQQLAA
jgi:integrase